jgi:cell pole-organizing protein PopZ
MLRDMLRPMLKEWLDQNLPSVVERLVEVEIARMARSR